VTGWDTPYPHAFEWEYFPGPARIAAAIRKVLEATISASTVPSPRSGSLNT